MLYFALLTKRFSTPNFSFIICFNVVGGLDIKLVEISILVVITMYKYINIYEMIEIGFRFK